MGTKTKSTIIKGLKTIVFLALGLFLIDTLGIILGMLCLFLITILFILIPSKQDKNIRRLKKELPITRIKDLKTGLVKIEGTVEAITPLISKLTEKKCIAYTYKVESVRYIRSGGIGKSTSSFSTIENNLYCDKFIIKDETGSVEVSSQNIIIDCLTNLVVKREINKRFSEQRLKNKVKVILIGFCNKDNIIEEDKATNTFLLYKLKKGRH